MILVIRCILTALLFARGSSAQVSDLLKPKEFSKKSKQFTLLHDHSRFAIGPVHYLGKKLFFSEKLFDSFPCIGKDLYFSNYLTPKAAPVRVAQLSCVLQLERTSSGHLLIRTKSIDNHVRTFSLDPNKDVPQLAEWKSNDSGELSFNERLALFDLDADLIDSPSVDIFPSGPGDRLFHSFYNPALKRSALTVSHPTTNHVLAISPPNEPTELLLQTSVTFDGNYIFFWNPNQVWIQHTSSNTPSYPSARLYDSKSTETAVQAPTEQKWSSWMPQAVSMVLVHQESSPGLWILDRNRELQDTIWYLDINDQSIAPMEHIRSEIVGSISSFRPIGNGLLLGREDGTILLATKGTAPFPQQAGHCNFRFSRLSYNNTEKTGVYYLRGTRSNLVTVVNGYPLPDFFCEGDLLVFLANPNSLRNSDIPHREGEEATKALIAIREGSIKLVQYPFRGTTFNAVESHPSSDSLLRIQATKSGTPRPYHWLLNKESLAVSGEEAR